MRRFTSGTTDQYIYFVAVDSSDLITRETGLTTFTVYRSRNGGAATAYTTPTIAEVSAANMPGVYSLLLDEDMTIGSGNNSEEVVLHITQASMAPVTLIYELYRPTVTEGETLTVSSGGLNAALGTGIVTAGSIAADAIGASELATDAVTEIVNAVWASTLSGILRTGTAQAGAAGTITLDASASATDNTYRYCTIAIISGTGSGQSRAISSYVGSTKVATVDGSWATNPDNTSVFIILPLGMVLADVTRWSGASVATPAVAGVPSVEVIDVSAAGLTDIRAAVGLASANLDTQIGTLATAANLATVAGYIDTEVAAILAAVDTEVGAIKAITDQISFTSGNVNVDVEMWQGTAVATPTVAGVPEVDVTHWLGTGVVASTAGYPDVNAARLGNSSNNIANISRIYGSAPVSLTADSGTTTTLTDAALTQSDVDYWKGQTIVFSSGTLAGVARRITGFDPTTDTLTFSPATPVAVSTHQYAIMPFSLADGASDADALLDRTAGVETGFTVRQTLRLMAAILLGKVSGGGTTTEVFRDLGDTKDRVTATVDASGNRTAVTRDAT